jgi:hypothetical protein
MMMIKYTLGTKKVIRKETKFVVLLKLRLLVFSHEQECQIQKITFVTYPVYSSSPILPIIAMEDERRMQSFHNN